MADKTVGEKPEMKKILMTLALIGSLALPAIAAPDHLDELNNIIGEVNMFTHILNSNKCMVCTLGDSYDQSWLDWKEYPELKEAFQKILARKQAVFIKAQENYAKEILNK